jgi:hypothetical protein
MNTLFLAQVLVPLALILWMLHEFAMKYQEAGAGVQLLVVHGSGGGHDRGMAFAGTLD